MPPQRPSRGERLILASVPDRNELDRRDPVRASDRDRNKVAAELRTHCVEGRITLEELEERLDGVIAARTIRELAELVYDLPASAAPAGQPEPGLKVRVGPPGRLPFTRRVTVPAPPEKTRALLLDKLAPGLNAFGYELVDQSSTGLVFERSSRPDWAVAAAIFLFPIGLLALGRRKTDRIVLSLEEHAPRRTDLTAHGTAPRRVRKAFAQLTFH